MSKILLSTLIVSSVLFFNACENRTLYKETELTEQNQQGLLETQPPPRITWSLERDNLIKRFRMMNDKAISFYMYVFIEGSSVPIGYYQINKVSSVNSQLTNTMQISNGGHVLPSPAEDGSYGSNGEGVFGFTPDNIYIEHNMKYIISSIPLTFEKPIACLTVINLDTKEKINKMMAKISN